MRANISAEDERFEGYGRYEVAAALLLRKHSDDFWLVVPLPLPTHSFSLRLPVSLYLTCYASLFVCLARNNRRAAFQINSRKGRNETERRKNALLLILIVWILIYSSFFGVLSLSLFQHMSVHSYWIMISHILKFCFASIHMYIL